ncbi:L,D-peptidoglycan transpeptidase YkuD (ErfK/YbiS/YcfS/YnhG family) [Streptacidiphilus sp. MAP12-20]|uniref:L,D-transpeptidase family protein n=1 Tax=Streptacidiphilus sp. MAP12-20 TaxID=3156299 RepID=UPI00351756DC
MPHASHGRHAKPRTPLLRSVAATAALGTAAAAISVLAAGTAQAASGDHAAGAVMAAQSATPHFPVPVRIGNAHQILTVQAHGSYATVTAWQFGPTGWHRVFWTTAARVGAHGITNGATRHQNTYTTPTGTYSITQGFGNGANPGTRMPYHPVTRHDWWVEDPSSAYYNQLRTDTQGGFHLTEAGYYGSEHLINYPTQYHNALVINFNMNPAVRGRGAGIFLHDLSASGGPTAGCVAVPAGVMTRIMQWINPAAHPVIAIG